jgi:hypothetical protein
MAKGGFNKGGVGNINHFAQYRLRVVGTGNLKAQISTLNDVIIKTMVPLPLATPNRIEPLRIINFVSQMAALEFKTTEINEFFQINTLVIFLKPIYTQYPS